MKTNDIAFDISMTFAGMTCIECGKLYFTPETANDEFNEKTDISQRIENVTLEECKCNECGGNAYNVDYFMRIK